MSAGLATARLTVLVRVDPDIARLRAALDVEALIELGWDPEQRVFAPSPDHAVFGFSECVVNGCIGVAFGQSGMCDACARRWRNHHRDLSREAFVGVQRPRIEGRRKREVLSYNRMLWTALRGKAAYLPGC